MAKTNKQLLASLIKADRQRKIKLAKEAGFSTSELYKTFLEDLIKLETNSNDSRAKAVTPTQKRKAEILSSSTKVGEILSEVSFVKVVQVKNNEIVVKHQNGLELTVTQDYVNTIMSSADTFSVEKKGTMTELAELFIRSSRVAITVAFITKDKAKTKTEFNLEVQEAISKVKSAKIGDVEKLLVNLIENPITKTIPGELRVMKGRHYGDVNELGRVLFVDMETDTNEFRLVDPRTIQYIILQGVKYSLK